MELTAEQIRKGEGIGANLSGANLRGANLYGVTGLCFSLTKEETHA